MGRPLIKRLTPTARAYLDDFKRRRPREARLLVSILERRYGEQMLQDLTTKELMRQVWGESHPKYDIFQ